MVLKSGLKVVIDPESNFYGEGVNGSNPQDTIGIIHRYVEDGWWEVYWVNRTINHYEYDDLKVIDDMGMTEEEVYLWREELKNV